MIETIAALAAVWAYWGSVSAETWSRYLAAGIAALFGIIVAARRADTLSGLAVFVAALIIGAPLVDGYLALTQAAFVAAAAAWLPMVVVGGIAVFLLFDTARRGAVRQK